MFIVASNGFGQFHDIVAAHERRGNSETVAWGACPTIFDPTQAPPGRHVAFLWEKLPYALRGNAANWDHEREIHGRHLLAADGIAPNLAGARARFVLAHAPSIPSEICPTWRAAICWSAPSPTSKSAGNRPFPGAGHYRTPVAGTVSVRRFDASWRQCHRALRV